VAWCAAWKTNGDIEGIGYLEPNPDARACLVAEI
jgi:hypothetical protein